MSMRGGSVEVENTSFQVDCPHFDGGNFRGWWSKLEQYFEAERIGEHAKVRAVMLHLEGKTLDWHQFFVHKHGGTVQLTWEMYARGIKERFGSVDQFHDANKVFQKTDWRLHPLPDEMLRYAREGTHYLLYIYDLMRIKLLSMVQEGEHLDTSLVGVYKRSSDVYTQLYEKELLIENSYLHIHGLQVAGFNAEQLAFVAGLCEWRDIIARAEDEGTGYILPNKTLLEITKQMSVAAYKLSQLLKSRYPYVERYLGAVVNIIRHAMQNAVAFEVAVQQLKMGHRLNTSEQHIAAKEGAEILIPMIPTDLKTANDRTRIIDDVGPDGISAQSASLQHKHDLVKIGSSITKFDRDKKQDGFSFEPHVIGSSMYAEENLVILGKSGDANAHTVIPPSAKMAIGATIQVLKKPSRGFGALLGNPSTEKKFDMEDRRKKSLCFWCGSKYSSGHKYSKSQLYQFIIESVWEQGSYMKSSSFEEFQNYSGQLDLVDPIPESPVLSLHALQGQLSKCLSLVPTGLTPPRLQDHRISLIDESKVVKADIFPEDSTWENLQTLQHHFPEPKSVMKSLIQNFRYSCEDHPWKGSSMVVKRLQSCEQRRQKTLEASRVSEIPNWVGSFLYLGPWNQICSGLGFKIGTGPFGS
ncbi:hypothetical protein J1N35_023812 [Gossypium stocksii]|uniref:HRDC domain-containing protein n=1 Tax=Gossypium stocksii TaxID=47602 RepID=A0A9D4A2F6_9ROSI|nr:hypothetical protein J1N35_023812 [Gossypium stocksii]